MIRTRLPEWVRNTFNSNKEKNSKTLAFVWTSAAPQSCQTDSIFRFVHFLRSFHAYREKHSAHFREQGGKGRWSSLSRPSAWAHCPGLHHMSPPSCKETGNQGSASRSERQGRRGLERVLHCSCRRWPIESWVWNRRMEGPSEHSDEPVWPSSFICTAL